MTSTLRSFEPVRREELPLPLAFLVSCLICALIFLTAYVIAIHRGRHPLPRPNPVRIVVVQLAAPVPPPPVAPPPDALPPPPPPFVVPVAPAATIAVPPVPPAPPARLRRTPPRRRAVHREPVRLMRPLVPPAMPAAVPAAPVLGAPPALPAAAANAAARDSLEGRIKQAIQRTQHYPESARMMAVSGTALVGFEYRDRSASAIHIIRSSASSVLDDEAMRDVRDAVLPPPGAMAGKTLSLEVAVVFDLVSDGD